MMVMLMQVQERICQHKSPARVMPQDAQLGEVFA
jgi:hypothetical protein